jgi:hypothetical protein
MGMRSSELGMGGQMTGCGGEGSARTRLTPIVAAVSALFMACSSGSPQTEGNLASVNQAINGNAISCGALADAVVANSGGVILNAQTVVDSYQSALGAYGGSNVGSDAVVQAAGSITNHAAAVNGILVPQSAAGLATIPVPTGATKLPFGSGTPGSLNINTAGASVTLAPGNYVAANITVSSPGSIKISPPGQVNIWVTGTLNLGGSENPNGAPSNLNFFVTSSGFVNVNSGGSLFGLIYAPTSQVNVNSPVFGSVIGGSVTLNSGAAVHYDSTAACPPPPKTVTTPTQLPPPPDVRGCYVGTWNGWVTVPCSPYDQLPAFIQQRPYIAGGQVTLPGYLDGGAMSFGKAPGITATSGLKFGQVETTFVDVVSTTAAPNAETNVPPQQSAIPECVGRPPTPNELSIQANTNPFPATSGDAAGVNDQAWVQFVLQSIGLNSGGAPGFNICIWNNDFTLGKADANTIPSTTAPICNATTPCATPRTCIGGRCLAPTYWPDCLATTNYAVNVGTASFNLAAQTRQLQTLDHATVAASAFTDANDGQADVGMVAALSWFDSSGNTADYHGLYAIVTSDRYGLGASTHWQNVSGTVLGMGDCGIGTFPQGTMVYTSVQAGNCATQGTPPPGVTVTWPGVCPNTLGISGSPSGTDDTVNYTDESNNLNIVGGVASPLALSTDGNNYLETHYLATVDGQCVSTPRVYVKDHPQDHGSTPSNLGGEAFWESPDIIVVPPTTTVTPTTPATDPVVIAGQTYAVYVRLHNEFACGPVNAVRARVRWGDASVSAPVWTDVITNPSDPSNLHWSAAKDLLSGDALDLIGPITWTAPSGVTPHECLRVDIQAAGEAAPADTTNVFDSYQIAQRNIEIGNACTWSLANGAQSSQLGVSLTATNTSGQSYLLASGDSVTVTFDDPGLALLAAWSANAHPGCSVAPGTAPNTTMLTMNTGVGRATVEGGPLAANAVLNVSSSVIPAEFSGTTIDLAIATYFTNGGTIMGPASNGATCSAKASTGDVPR